MGTSRDSLLSVKVTKRTLNNLGIIPRYTDLTTCAPVDALTVHTTAKLDSHLIRWGKGLKNWTEIQCKRRNMR